MRQIVANESRSIMTVSQCQIAKIIAHIINTVWDDKALSSAFEIMVIHFAVRFIVVLTSAVKVTQEWAQTAPVPLKSR